MIETHYFKYGQEEIEYLKSRDQALAVAIQQIGHINRLVIPDIFTALLKSIVGQQISTQAQETIWNRILERFAPLTPENISLIPAEELQSCGLSFRKVTYIKGLADAVLDGSLNLDQLPSMSDEEVIKSLTQIKGIGVWTAEMILIFSMERPNVISYSDLAILRGLRMLYRHRKITPQLFAKYKRRYSPYASVASLYLWAIAGGALPDLTDPAPKKKVKKKGV